jgi:hypothetical protein
MPAISYDHLAAWSNYHLTIGKADAAHPAPAMTVKSLGHVHAADAGDLPGLERFAATAKALMGHVAKLGAMLEPTPDEPSPSPFAAGLVGRGWSFSPLIGTPVSMLECEGLAGTSALEAADWNPRCGTPSDRIALTSGGTRLREIVQWAERGDLTVMTSGTHLGPTIAGGACTASHGSRLGYGGIQDMILGMHLIVGTNEHVWIERASRPVLSEEGRRKLEFSGATFRHVADDERFEDALVHLGGMGIVNGVALELVENQPFALMLRHAPLTQEWLEEIAAGAFGKIARRLQCTAAPIFHELTFNPHAPFTDDAAHIMYFPRSAASLVPPGEADIMRPADAFGRIGFDLSPRAEALAAPDPWVVQALQLVLKKHPSAFSYYRDLAGFKPNDSPYDPDGPDQEAHYWSGLHRDEITGNSPGALYNASFAIPLDRVAAAVPAICRAVQALEPSFVFTLRFVRKAAGTLAFTRFTDCAVIEIDGLSPFICELIAATLPSDVPHADELRKAYLTLATTLPRGARAVRQALDEASIPHSLHWAKLGDLDRAKVYKDFGHPADAESLVRQWRDTRAFLLTSLGKRLFWNEALVSYGLLERPS